MRRFFFGLIAAALIISCGGIVVSADDSTSSSALIENDEDSTSSSALVLTPPVSLSSPMAAGAVLGATGGGGTSSGGGASRNFNNAYDYYKSPYIVNGNTYEKYNDLGGFYYIPITKTNFENEVLKGYMDESFLNGESNDYGNAWGIYGTYVDTFTKENRFVEVWKTNPINELNTLDITSESVFYFSYDSMDNCVMGVYYDDDLYNMSSQYEMGNPYYYMSVVNSRDYLLNYMIANSTCSSLDVGIYTERDLNYEGDILCYFNVYNDLMNLFGVNKFSSYPQSRKFIVYDESGLIDQVPPYFCSAYEIFSDTTLISYSGIETDGVTSVDLQPVIDAINDVKDSVDNVDNDVRNIISIFGSDFQDIISSLKNIDDDIKNISDTMQTIDDDIKATDDDIQNTEKDIKTINGNVISIGSTLFIIFCLIVVGITVVISYKICRAVWVYIIQVWL